MDLKVCDFPCICFKFLSSLPLSSLFLFICITKICFRKMLYVWQIFLLFSSFQLLKISSTIIFLVNVFIENPREPWIASPKQLGVSHPKGLGASHPQSLWLPCRGLRHVDSSGTIGGWLTGLKVKLQVSILVKIFKITFVFKGNLPY